MKQHPSRLLVPHILRKIWLCGVRVQVRRLRGARRPKILDSSTWTQTRDIIYRGRGQPLGCGAATNQKQPGQGGLPADPENATPAGQKDALLGLCIFRGSWESPLPCFVRRAVLSAQRDPVGSIGCRIQNRRPRKPLTRACGFFSRRSGSRVAKNITLGFSGIIFDPTPN